MIAVARLLPFAILQPAGGLIPPVAVAGLFLSRSHHPVLVQQVAAPPGAMYATVPAGIALFLTVVPRPAIPSAMVWTGVVEADDERFGASKFGVRTR